MAQRPGFGKTKPGADLGSPSDFGASSAPRRPPARAQQVPATDIDPDQDGDIDSVDIPPEAVNYHDDLQRCDMCRYMNENGDCAVLKMPVSAEGACTVFQAQGEQEGAEQPEEQMGAEEPEPEMAGPPARRGGYGV